MKVIPLTDAQKAQIATLQQAIIQAQDAASQAQTPVNAARNALNVYLNSIATAPATAGNKATSGAVATAVSGPQRPLRGIQLSDDGSFLVM
jgi:hypothetical protein